MGDNRQLYMLTCIEGETDESPEFGAVESGVAIAAVLGLNCPVLTAYRLRDEIDALIILGQVEIVAHVCGHFGQQPYLVQLGLVCWVCLQVELGEPLESGPLLFRTEIASAVQELIPGTALDD